MAFGRAPLLGVFLLLGALSLGACGTEDGSGPTTGVPLPKGPPTWHRLPSVGDRGDQRALIQASAPRTLSLVLEDTLTGDREVFVRHAVPAGGVVHLEWKAFRDPDPRGDIPAPSAEQVAAGRKTPTGWVFMFGFDEGAGHAERKITYGPAEGPRVHARLAPTPSLPEPLPLEGEVELAFLAGTAGGEGDGLRLRSVEGRTSLGSGARGVYGAWRLLLRVDAPPAVRSQDR